MAVIGAAKNGSRRVGVVLLGFVAGLSLLAPEARADWKAILGGMAEAMNTRELALGEATESRLATGETQRFLHKVDQPGMLVVAVTGANPGGDFQLFYQDEDGQMIGSEYAFDNDLNGNMTHEVLMIEVLQPGTYTLALENFGGEASDYTLHAGWHAIDREIEADQDGRPSQARPLAMGPAVQDRLDPHRGDRVDWYEITPTAGGYLVVVTQATDPAQGGGDLYLEFFRPNDTTNAYQYADCDYEGDGCHEGAVLFVREGERFLMRVKAMEPVATGYQVSARMLPGVPVAGLAVEPSPAVGEEVGGPAVGSRAEETATAVIGPAVEATPVPGDQPGPPPGR